MKKLLNKLVLLIGLGLAASAFADGDIDRVFNTGSTGTTSATAIVSPSDSPMQVTDLVWDLDNTVTTGTVDISIGNRRLAVSSATSGSGSVIWFDNSQSLVASGDYLIAVVAGTSTLVRTKGTVATTSATIQETLAAMATTDALWTTATRIRRNAPDLTTSSTLAPVSIWLPANVPAAFTIDGNTTACKISLSGVRSAYK